MLLNARGVTARCTDKLCTAGITMCSSTGGSRRRALSQSRHPIGSERGNGECSVPGVQTTVDAQRGRWCCGRSGWRRRQCCCRRRYRCSIQCSAGIRCDPWERVCTVRRGAGERYEHAVESADHDSKQGAFWRFTFLVSLSTDLDRDPKHDAAVSES